MSHELYCVVVVARRLHATALILVSVVVDPDLDGPWARHRTSPWFGIGAIESPRLLAADALEVWLTRGQREVCWDRRRCLAPEGSR